MPLKLDVEPSLNNDGQVFGGEVHLQGKDGRVWVFRHVDPNLNIQKDMQLRAGDPIATVTWWEDNRSRSHTHIELWKTLEGSARLSRRDLRSRSRGGAKSTREGPRGIMR